MRFYLFVILLVVLAGCGSGGTQRVRPDTGGVELEFIEGKPDFDGIYEDRPFGVEVKLKNFLEEDVSGEVCAYDSPGDEFGGIKGKDCKSVELDAAVFLEGAFIDVVEKRYSFGPYTYSKLPLGLEDTNVKVDVKYMTSSRISAPVCLKKDPGFETDFECEDSVTIKGDEMYRDISPVTVKQIDSKILSAVDDTNTLVLDIMIEKEDKGKVIKSLSDDEPLMAVDISLGGTAGDFSCAGLRDGFLNVDLVEEKIRCTGDIRLSDVAYDDTIEIKLDYGYKLTIPDPPKAIRVFRLDEIGG
tara:strand:- start:7662 stop:8561 length:900 start_codon:yes stop_codon:yes gene_type:complete